MSIIWKDGMDMYRNTADVGNYYSYASATLNTTSGRWGGGTIQCSGVYDNVFRKSIAANNISECIYGISSFFIASGSTQAGYFAGQYDDIGLTYVIHYDPTTETMSFRLGNAVSTILSSASVTGLMGVWNFFEVRYKMHASTGAFEMRVNNKVITGMSYSGNTKPNGSATKLSNVFFGTYTGSLVRTLLANHDDLYIVDPNDGVGLTTYAGDIRIQYLVPTSDQSPNNGTQSTGANHWGCVDEVRVDTADYITITNTSGQAENFGFSSLVGTPTTIFSVDVMNFVTKSDSGSLQVRGRLTSGGTTALGPDSTTTTSGLIIHSPFEVNPDTSASFTPSEVNALKAGVRIT